MDTLIDEAVELDVDLDATVPCEVDECPNVATWSAVQQCPPRHSYPICDEHKRSAEEALGRARAVAAMLDITGAGRVTCTCNICPPGSPPLEPPYIVWRPL
jgi:hypothetical protein